LKKFSSEEAKNCKRFPVEILFVPRWRGRQKKARTKEQKQGI
jgi:hypothetical protein